MRKIIESIEGEYRRYKTLAEGAIQQMTEQQLAQSIGGNSVATIVWHISGNLASRFTDFLHSDGEKPWREREEEFRARTAPRAELLEKWEKGWTILFQSLAELTDDQLEASVRIRAVPLAVREALHRSLAHTSYHVGQIVFLAKALRGSDWRYLSIPPGGSAAYNENPSLEKPPSSAGEVGV